MNPLKINLTTASHQNKKGEHQLNINFSRNGKRKHVQVAYVDKQKFDKETRIVVDNLAVTKIVQCSHKRATELLEILPSDISLSDFRMCLVKGLSLSDDSFTTMKKNLAIMLVSGHNMETIIAEVIKEPLGVIEAFEKMLEGKTSNIQYGTKETYYYSLVRLKKTKWIRKIPRILKLKHENVVALEKELNQKHNGSGTVGICMRNLRSVYNYTCTMQSVNPISNLFHNIKSLSTKVKEKDCFNKTELESIIQNMLSDDSRTEIQKLYTDLIITNYYLAGIDFVDVALLKKSDKHHEQTHLAFSRSKVTKTKSNGKKRKIYIPIHNHLRPILKKYFLKKTNTDFLFPIFEKQHLKNEKIMYRRRRYYNRKVNDYLKRKAKELNIVKEEIHWDMLRASIANIYREDGMMTEVIAKYLGHSNMEITQKHYLDDKIPELSLWLKSDNFGLNIDHDGTDE